MNGLLAAVSTGNEEFDKKLGGGIPRGSLVMVEGASDAGKSVLVQHFCWGSLLADGRVAFYTSENTVRSLLRQMLSLGLDLSDFLLLNRLAVYPLNLTVPGRTGQQVLAGLLAHMRHTNHDVIIIDSLTPALGQASAQEISRFFTACKELTDRGRTVIAAVHSEACDEITMLRVRSMCDAHLVLRVEQVGERLVKVLEVAKVRGAGRNTGAVVNFDVEPGMGMRLIPIARAKA